MPIPSFRTAAFAQAIAIASLAQPCWADAAPPQSAPEPAMDPCASVTDPQRTAAAEGLFQEARRATDAGDHPKACALFEESQAVEPAAGTLLYVAECYERIGRTASAWSTFEVAAGFTPKIGQTKRQAIAKDRAARLVPRLTRLSVKVPEADRVPGLTVKRDELTLGPSAYGVGVPVDPGGHVVTAHAGAALEAEIRAAWGQGALGFGGLAVAGAAVTDCHRRPHEERSAQTILPVATADGARASVER